MIDNWLEYATKKIQEIPDVEDNYSDIYWIHKNPYQDLVYQNLLVEFNKISKRILNAEKYFETIKNHPSKYQGIYEELNYKILQLEISTYQTGRKLPIIKLIKGD